MNRTVESGFRSMWSYSRAREADTSDGMDAADGDVRGVASQDSAG